MKIAERIMADNKDNPYGARCDAVFHGIADEYWYSIPGNPVAPKTLVLVFADKSAIHLMTGSTDIRTSGI